MTENEFLLEDRISVIKSLIAKEGENKFYLSFSGGKDSTILHRLLDIALPGNKIPRVFIDTGIEYNAIRKFVLGLAEKDDRFVIIKPSQPIKKVLETYGYPFKSKQHAHNVMVYQNSGIGRSVQRYLGIIESNTLFRCPKMLEYQFTEDFKMKVSDQCCLRLKKMPAHKYEKESGRTIAITGMRREEGGKRKSIKGCVLTDKEGNVRRFHPLLVVSEEWEDWFAEREKIELCELYRPPFNFKRTGCKFCPFSLDLEEQLELAYRYMPNEAKQAEIIWKPVFDEYRRIGFRLHDTMQIKLDLEEDE